jgi:phosphate transport system ATP-binding protein
MPIYDKRVTALIGPSGCGKSTFLRCFNRMHDLYPGNRYEGEIRLHPDNVNLLDKARSIRSRCACACRWCSRSRTRFPSRSSRTSPTACACAASTGAPSSKRKVEEALRSAALWNEAKDRLHEQAFNLSGGQQQRLCIARALATEPEILLFDEPTSALDPIATASIEELIAELKEKVTILIVTHNMQQAARVSDFTAYMYIGELIEFGWTDDIFIKPKHEQTEAYITGRFG